MKLATVLENLSAQRPELFTELQDALLASSRAMGELARHWDHAVLYGLTRRLWLTAFHERTSSTFLRTHIDELEEVGSVLEAWSDTYSSGRDRRAYLVVEAADKAVNHPDARGEGADGSQVHLDRALVAAIDEALAKYKRADEDTDPEFEIAHGRMQAAYVVADGALVRLLSAVAVDVADAAAQAFGGAS